MSLTRPEPQRGTLTRRHRAYDSTYRRFASDTGLLVQPLDEGRGWPIAVGGFDKGGKLLARGGCSSVDIAWVQHMQDTLSICSFLHLHFIEKDDSLIAEHVNCGENMLNPTLTRSGPYLRCSLCKPPLFLSR